jgi:hypothetical protein
MAYRPFYMDTKAYNSLSPEDQKKYVAMIYACREASPNIPKFALICAARAKRSEGHIKNTLDFHAFNPEVIQIMYDVVLYCKANIQ